MYGSAFEYSYAAQYLTGCHDYHIAHIAHVYLSVSGDGFSYPASQTAVLLDYGDFAISHFAEDLIASVGDAGDFVARCENIAPLPDGDPAVFDACVSAARAEASYPTRRVYGMVAQMFAAGALHSELYALLDDPDVYVDPIPPAPEGHEVVEGYDLDAAVAGIEGAGGLATLAVIANTIPFTNSNGGSTNDLSEAVLAVEARGGTVREAVQVLVNLFGVGVFTYLVAVDLSPGDQHRANPTPNSPLPPPGAKPKGGSANTITIDPDPYTVNEVLRSWYRRIAEGGLGTAAVAADQEELLPEDRLRAVAQQCLRDVAAAARAGAVFESPNPCRDMPIFVPAGDGSGSVSVNLDAFEAARHDREAISNRPEWAQLNYMSGTAKGTQVNREWYKRNPFWASSGCKANDSSQACDEYPLYSSTQGGPARSGGSGASLKPVDKKQNSAEGSVYSVMVRSPSCAMESAPPVPAGTSASGGTPFLVIPMPGLPIPTFFLC